MRVFLFATAVPCLFRLRLSVLNQVLEPWASPGPAPRADSTRHNEIIRCFEMARAVGRPVISPKCLTRAVTLYYFLRRAGLDLTLCFGAARQGTRLVTAAGHCWLVKNGEPFLETRDPRADFVPIYWLPNPRTG